MDDVTRLFSRVEGEDWPPATMRGHQLRAAADARSRRRGAVAVGGSGLAVVALVVGVRLPQRDAGPVVVPAVSPTTQSTAVLPPQPSPSRSAGVVVRPVKRPCTVKELSAHISPGSPGAGQRYAEIWLTNVSASPCTVQGYGGAALLHPAVAFRTTFVRTGAKAAPLVVAPGAIVSSLLHWSPMEGAGDCGVAPARIAVTPPDERASLMAAWPSGVVCTLGHVYQDPYVAGRGR